MFFFNRRCTDSTSSLNSDQNQTSSSDSKLYRHRQAVENGVSTYPFMHKDANVCYLNNFCGSDVSISNSRSFLKKSKKADCLENMCSDSGNNDVCTSSLDQRGNKYSCDNISNLSDQDKYHRASTELDSSSVPKNIDSKFSDKRNSYGSSGMLFGLSDSKSGEFSDHESQFKS